MTRSPLFKGFPSKRLGEFINFTGIDSKYKASEEPEVRLDNGIRCRRVR
jgi:adenylylsulfate kinase-like enzyme